MKRNVIKKKPIHKTIRATFYTFLIKKPKGQKQPLQFIFLLNFELFYKLTQKSKLNLFYTIKGIILVRIELTSHVPQTCILAIERQYVNK